MPISYPIVTLGAYRWHLQLRLGGSCFEAMAAVRTNPGLRTSTLRYTWLSEAELECALKVYSWHEVWAPSHNECLLLARFYRSPRRSDMSGVDAVDHRPARDVIPPLGGTRVSFYWI